MATTPRKSQIKLTNTVIFPVVCAAAAAAIGVAWTYDLGHTPSIMLATNNLGSTAGGTVAIITGHNFQPGAKVYFGDVPATIVEVPESTTAVVTAPPHEAGTVAFTIINPDGRKAVTANGFQYNSLKPSVGSVLPNHGPVAGGTLVTVMGSAYTASNVKVQLHGNVITPAVISDTELNFVTPPSETPMEVNLSVMSEDGSLTSDSANFFYE